MRSPDAPDPAPESPAHPDHVDTPSGRPPARLDHPDDRPPEPSWPVAATPVTPAEAEPITADAIGDPPPFLVALRGGATRLTRTHRWGFGAFLLAELVFLLSSVLIALPFGDVRHNPAKLPTALLVSLTVPTVLAAVVAVLATWLRGNGPIIDLGLRLRWADITQGLGIGVIGLVITTAGSELWARWVGAGNANSAVGDLTDGVRFPPLLGVVLFLHLWLLAPLCEEIVYRGLLWGAFERWRWSRWLCLAGSTAIFAVAHLEPLRTPLLLVIGIPIGLARLVTNRLPASVVVHSMNNLLPAVGILLMSQGVLH